MHTWLDGYISVDGTPIHYHRTGGDKPPLILLHGFMDNGLCWTRVARALEARYDLLMIDTRYHGRSGRSANGYSYDLAANDVATIAHELDLGPAYLFGHSMGAMTAMVVAATLPELAQALILEDPFLPDGATTSAETEQSTAEDFRLLIELRNASAEERLVMARQANPGWDDEEILPWIASKVEFDLEMLAAVEGALNYPWRETMARVSCPLLVITADPQRRALITPQRILEMSQIWQAGETVHINDAGHCIHRDQYDETMKAVWAFLEKH